MVEQGLAPRRDGEDVSDAAIAEARVRTLLNQPLSLERTQVRCEPAFIYGVALQVFREDGPKPRGAFEEIHFGSPEPIDLIPIADGLAVWT
jgi:hypothetical protein